MTSLVELLLLVVVATSVHGSYYRPVVPYRVAAPGAGYLLPAYVPPYSAYHVAPSSEYYPPAGEQSKQYQEDAKYYYGGKFQGSCSNDGLYYKDDATFVICSNGYPSDMPCPPGTKTASYPTYQAGYYYGYTDLCSVNLVDYGYGPSSYSAESGNSEPANKDKTYTKSEYDSYSESAPNKDTYSTPRNTYQSEDPYSTKTSYSEGSPYQAKGPSYPQKSTYPAKGSDYSKETYGAKDTYTQKNTYGAKDTYTPKIAYGAKDTYTPKDTYGDKDSYSSKDSYGAKDSYGVKDSYASDSSYPASAPAYPKNTYTPTSDYQAKDRPSYPVPNPYLSKDTYQKDEYSSKNAYPPKNPYPAPYSPRPTYPSKPSSYPSKDDYSKVTYPVKTSYQADSKNYQ